jgi:hypothetical protein
MKTLVKINPIYRDLAIALTMGFAAAVGIVSAVVIIFG